jgi:hypothetical protein
MKGECMILAEDYGSLLQDIGTEYFIRNLQFVPDLISWAAKQDIALSEPHQLMKLVPSGAELTMVIQSEIPDELLDNLVTNLSVRWSIKDNVNDPSKTLNSVKKRLVFAFMKEYARTVSNVGGDEFIEDEWALRAIEKLGFFRE